MRASPLLPCVLVAGCLVNRDLYDDRRAALGDDTGGGSWGVGFDSDSDCISADARDLVLDGPFTFDAYLRAAAAPGYAVFPVVAWPGAFAVYQDSDGWLVVGPTGKPDASTGASSPTSLFDGAYHHVAVTYGQSGYASLYVDGTRLAYASVDLGTARGDTLYLGCWPDQDAAFRGDIGEARLSAAAFYSGDFEPEWVPYEVGSATLALWHLDEGEGTVAHDAVEAAPGRLAGGAWVTFPLEGEPPQ